MKKQAAEQKPVFYQVAIIGGGMVGMTLAIALGQAGLKVALVEKHPFEDQVEPKFDGRVSAISCGSRRIFENLNLWADMQKEAEPILDIRVVDNDAPVFVHYHYRDVGKEPLGHIVENRITRNALIAGLKRSPSIDLFTGTKLSAMERSTGRATLTLEDGRKINCSLVVGAEGRNSVVRKIAGIKTTELPYNQTAIVCTIGPEKPHLGLALERFLPAGPFAVLPMTGNRCSLVWTEPTEAAPHYLQLPEKELIAEIRKRVGEYLGELHLEGPRFTYPLSLQYSRKVIEDRVVLVGDAAQAIHPIAGQGVNLGYRDVAALEELVVEAHRLGLDIGAATVLENYPGKRRFDVTSMMTVTDGLTRIFSTDRQPFRWGRRAGLDAVQHMPILKRFFMRHAMGITGDLPRLMRVETKKAA